MKRFAKLLVLAALTGGWMCQTACTQNIKSYLPGWGTQPQNGGFSLLPLKTFNPIKFISDPTFSAK